MKKLFFYIFLLNYSVNIYAVDFDQTEEACCGYKKVRNELFESLKNSRYSQENFVEFLGTAHTKKPILNFPCIENKKLFIKDLMNYVAKEYNSFMHNFLCGGYLDEERARIMIGAVNVSLLDDFSSVFSKGSEKRKILMCFIKGSLKKISNLRNISERLKNEIDLNILIFGIIHLDEMLEYMNYEDLVLGQKKKDWMSTYWEALKGHPSDSQYLNTLGALLLKQGHNADVTDPLYPFFPAAETTESRTMRPQSRACDQLSQITIEAR